MNFIEESIQNFSQSTGLDQEDVRSIFDELIMLLPIKLLEMSEAVTIRDFDTLKNLAHQLKGSCGNLMIISLSDAGSRLEKAAIDQDMGSCFMIVKEIEKIVDSIDG